MFSFVTTKIVQVQKIAGLAMMLAFLNTSCGDSKEPKKAAGPVNSADSTDTSTCKTKADCKQLPLEITSTSSSGTEIEAELDEQISVSFSGSATGATDRVIALRITKYPSGCSVSGQDTTNPSLSCDSTEEEGSLGSVEVLARDITYLKVAMGLSDTAARKLSTKRTDDTTKTFSLAVVENEDSEDDSDTPTTNGNSGGKTLMACVAGGLPAIISGQGMMNGVLGCMSGLMGSSNNNSNILNTNNSNNTNNGIVTP